MAAMNKAAQAILAFQQSLLDNSSWEHLWEEDAVLTFPFASSLSMPSKLDGVAAIKNHMDFVMADAANASFPTTKIHPIAGDEGAVVEFEMHCTVKSTGKPYDQKYVGIVYLSKNGKIQTYTEYWNVDVILKAFAGTTLAELL